LDLAKYVFQAHGADASGKVVFRKRLRRGKVLEFFAGKPVCLVAMEACSSAHHWARELARLGHVVRLIPPAYVKPFVKRQKNDAADAEAVCEAAQRPTMRFVAVKSETAQANAVVFRARDLLVRQRTQAINALRGHLGAEGDILPRSRERRRYQMSDLAKLEEEAFGATLLPRITRRRALEIELFAEELIAGRARSDPPAVAANQRHGKGRGALLSPFPRVPISTQSVGSRFVGIF
jgi:transposase